MLLPVPSLLSMHLCYLAAGHVLIVAFPGASGSDETVGLLLLCISDSNMLLGW